MFSEAQCMESKSMNVACCGHHVPPDNGEKRHTQIYYINALVCCAQHAR